MTLSPSLIILTGFPQRLNTFLPPSKGSAGLKVLPSKINRPYTYNNDEKEIEQTQGGSNSTSLWGSDGFKDYSQGSGQSGRSGDKTLQHSSHAAISRRGLSLEQSQAHPLRKRQVSVICQADII